MKIAILGTRGIPNAYGGFEQFAEYLSVGLVARGHSVTVYNASFHEYARDTFKGVAIRKIFNPEKHVGASANFIYDFFCLRDALNNNFDIIYELGYHSNAPSYYLLGKNSPVVVTNMDGIEWKRAKWSAFTQKLIRKLENIAVKKSDYLLSDNPAIRNYYLENFGKDSFYIPYGAEIVNNFDESILSAYNVGVFGYYLTIARLERENNIEMILDGFIHSRSEYPFLVVGNCNNRYGKFLQNKYKRDNIRFLGGIYEKQILDNLRHFARIYFHGHSVGGTNPSLLEAMASGIFIAAHDNPFNREVLGDDADYFGESGRVCSIIQDQRSDNDRIQYVRNNIAKIERDYSWDSIVLQYENLFYSLLRE